MTKRMDREPVLLDISNALDAWHFRLGRQFGLLSRHQRRFMKIIALNPNIVVSDIADKLKLTIAGVTRMLDRLEQLEYISRTRQNADQRQVSINLTPLGSETLDESDQIYLDRLNRSLQELSDDDRHTLACLLQKISHTISGWNPNE